MPLRTGDIDELSDYWSDENSARGNGNIYGNSGHGSVEETRVGTQASFEQMLERELAKEQAQNGGSAPRRGAAPAKPRKQFLKKGARGWWMENPNAKQKMQRHVLESVELDDNNQAVRAMKAPKASAQPQRPTTTGGRRSPQTRSAGTTSPEPVRRHDAAPVDTSPVRLAPTSTTGEERAPFEGPRRSLFTWARASVNVRESVETLNMSGVRQDFETRREREAHELADFEALEQELAAEKESYLREKMEVEDRDSKSYYADDDDDASWLRDSEDARSLHSASPHLLSGAYRTSYSNLDLGGESSMVFDGDHVFRSPMPRASNARGSVRPRHSRPSFAPSDISAVSLNDSEPWGDANVLGHFSNLPESPIANHGMASTVLNNAQQSRPSQVNGSRNHDSQWNGRSVERTFEDGNYTQASELHNDDYDFETSTDRADSPVARRSMGRQDAPVSSLVQQVFGGAMEATESWDHEDYHSREQARTDPQRATGTVTSKKSLSQQPIEPRRIKGRKVSRPPNTRDKNSEQEQPDRGARKRVPGLNQTGILPVSIEEKLAELEEEVKFYKSETLQLQRKKSQYDEELQRIAREKENIVHFQEEQRQLIAQEWHQQRQKMKHEERMFERQMKLKLSAAASAGSRKDRAEIDGLKAQIVALQLEAKQASSKMKSTNDVLRQRIAELEGKNRELSEEIKFLERDRLDQWQKYEDLLKELNSQKPKQDGDRVPVKTVGDVTRVGRSAEQLLGSLRLSAAHNATDSRGSEPARSLMTTPTYDHGDDYNPSRYSNSEVSRCGSARSSQAGSKHSKEGDDDDRRDSASVGDGDSTVDDVVHPGGKREITYRDGTKRIFFADGNEKEILPNGNVVIRFTNGDRKEYFPDTGVSVYHYHEAQTKLTTYPDKTKVYEFPNQQIEKSYPDGTTEIQFADGITKTIHPGGDEFSKFPDGTTMLETKDGLREVTLLNGKRVRYYPDGKMTLVTVDGQESEVRSDEELRHLMESI